MLTKQEDILTKEEIFWRQKLRERWLSEGDRNTKFFHNSTLHNRAMSKILSIKNHKGILIDKPNENLEIMVEHFQQILNNFEG